MHITQDIERVKLQVTVVKKHISRWASLFPLSFFWQQAHPNDSQRAATSSAGGFSQNPLKPQSTAHYLSQLTNLPLVPNT